MAAVADILYIAAILLSLFISLNYHILQYGSDYVFIDFT
jgi:hypothetical protein